jgi:hypothetical protein
MEGSVSLAGVRVFVVEDEALVLADRNVPFVFTSGHDRDLLPARFRERRSDA